MSDGTALRIRTTSDLTSADHDVIWDIINNFDFDYVHRVMTLIKWGWYQPECDSIEIPDIEHLRDTARNMLVECTSRARKVSGQYTLGSGGFFVYAEYEPSTSKVYLKLAFELSSWDNY